MSFSFFLRAVRIAASLWACAFVANATQAAPNERSNSNTVAAIRVVLAAQEAAWNRGDLVGFMNGYARSPRTTFVSGDKVTRGWETVLHHYQKKYATAAKMGRLTFSQLEVQPLGADYAMALGRWDLARRDDHPRGRFTLLFHRLPEGWRIVQDHTS